MNSGRNDDFQDGSLRIRVSANGALDLVRYDGDSQDWITVENNSDPELQKAMRAAVPTAAQPGYYAPTPLVGKNARLPLKAA